MKKGFLATAMLSFAMTLGWKDEVKIKKAVEINRNWKEDQPKYDKTSRLEKARLKRIRKSELKRINSLKSAGIYGEV